MNIFWILVIVIGSFFLLMQLLVVFGKNNRNKNKNRNVKSNKTREELFLSFEEQRIGKKAEKLKNDSKTEIVNNKSTFITNKSLSKSLDEKTKIKHQEFNFPASDNYSEFYISGTNYLTSEEFAQIDVLETGERLFLVAEPTNSYDDRAIMVMNENKVKFGYIPTIRIDDFLNCDDTLREVDCYFSGFETADNYPKFYIRVYY